MAWSRVSGAIVYLFGLGYAAGFVAGPALGQTGARPGAPWNPRSPSEQMRQQARFAKAERTIPPTPEPPKKKGEIDCTVEEWTPSDTSPVLGLVCPPPQVFSPLRVHLKVSWLKVGDIPKVLHRIVAEPHMPVRIRPTSSTLRVLLRVSKHPEDAGKEEWIGFNSVLGVGLEGE